MGKYVVVLFDSYEASSIDFRYDLARKTPLVNQPATHLQTSIRTHEKSRTPSPFANFDAHE